MKWRDHGPTGGDVHDVYRSVESKLERGMRPHRLLSDLEFILGMPKPREEVVFDSVYATVNCLLQVAKLLSSRCSSQTRQRDACVGILSQ